MYERLQKRGETRPVQDVFVHKTPKKELWEDKKMWTERPVQIHNDLRKNYQSANPLYVKAETEFKNLQELSKVLLQMRHDKAERGKVDSIHDAVHAEDREKAFQEEEKRLNEGNLDVIKETVNHFIDKKPPLFIHWR